MQIYSVGVKFWHKKCKTNYTKGERKRKCRGKLKEGEQEERKNRCRDRCVLHYFTSLLPHQVCNKYVTIFSSSDQLLNLLVPSNQLKSFPHRACNKQYVKHENPVNLNIILYFQFEYTLQVFIKQSSLICTWEHFKESSKALTSLCQSITIHPVSVI